MGGHVLFFNFLMGARAYVLLGQTRVQSFSEQKQKLGLAHALRMSGRMSITTRHSRQFASCGWTCCGENFILAYDSKLQHAALFF